jgi:type II secretion system protein G
MNRKGFTLMELLVVVLIIGILSAIAMPQYLKSVEKARASEAVTMLGAIGNAIDRYRMSNVDGSCTGISPDALDVVAPNAKNFTYTIPSVADTCKATAKRNNTANSYIINVEVNTTTGVKSFTCGDDPKKVCASLNLTNA